MSTGISCKSRKVIYIKLTVSKYFKLILVNIRKAQMEFINYISMIENTILIATLLFIIGSGVANFLNTVVVRLSKDFVSIFF
jgi:hypothetical protein